MESSASCASSRTCSAAWKLVIEASATVDGKRGLSVFGAKLHLPISPAHQLTSVECRDACDAQSIPVVSSVSRMEGDIVVVVNEGGSGEAKKRKNLSSKKRAETEHDDSTAQLPTSPPQRKPRWAAAVDIVASFRGFLLSCHQPRHYLLKKHSHSLQKAARWPGHGHRPCACTCSLAL